eukprot:TRINITY_DN1366_c0_g1_i1.p1 TRINITY_DN1366_c0_g1~~TRINITY_DN1366_c0_g1_i1.p1  ORF type:complete len:508 (+),score=134.05 TRINITY_DN1366_c0_g1_i1:98-1621(+)
MAPADLGVLVVGSGGREHALGWKIAKSRMVKKLYFAPGNAGSASVGENLPIAVGDFDALKAACVDKGVQLVVVGPEDPLCNGINDSFAEDPKTAHITVVGPKQAGARIEASKAFAKELMAKYGVPTAAYKAFTKDTLAEGQKFLETLKPPYVLKADGLAAGKGVLIVPGLAEAKAELASMLGGKFGAASGTVVIEEFLDGRELSVFALVDTKGHYHILPTATDWKRAGDGDTGLNTGGMGAVSPCPYATEDSKFLSKVRRRVVEPMVKGMLKDGLGYCGFLYCGLMRCGDEPKVVEFNCRMGDPETEAVLPRIKNDLVPLLLAVGKGNLHEKKLVYDSRHTCTVVLVSGGYPGSYPKGKAITGLDEVGTDCTVFHAGTKAEGGGIVTSGGRVLAVTCFGQSLDAAADAAYANLPKVRFEGCFARSDIATWGTMRMPAGGARAALSRVLKVLGKRGEVELTGSGDAAATAVGVATEAEQSGAASVARIATRPAAHAGEPEVAITLRKK